METQPKLALRLDVDPRAPQVARREIRSFAAALGEEMRSNLALLVTELVTNSLRHAVFRGQRWIDLQACINATAVRVEVADPGASFAPERAGDREGGWGFLLVDRMASRWGIEREEQTRVWFEADLSDGNGRKDWLQLVESWPEQSRAAARAIGTLFGAPVGQSDTMLFWERPDGTRLVLERGRPPQEIRRDPSA